MGHRLPTHLSFSISFSACSSTLEPDLDHLVLCLPCGVAYTVWGCGVWGLGNDHIGEATDEQEMPCLIACATRRIFKTSFIRCFVALCLFFVILLLTLKILSSWTVDFRAPLSLDTRPTYHLLLIIT